MKKIKQFEKQNKRVHKHPENPTITNQYIIKSLSSIPGQARISL
jgi:hypothetical protein